MPAKPVRKSPKLAAAPAAVDEPVSVRAVAKEATREALVKAAIELFGEEGLDAPSLDAICERAGFTRGAFYVHFEDREALLEAVMDRVGEQFFSAVLPTEGEGKERTLSLVTGDFLQAVATGKYPLIGKKALRPHQLLEACARSKRIRKKYLSQLDETERRLTSLVRASQAAGEVRADVGAAPIAKLLLGAVVGAQTMMDLGMSFDLPAMAVATMHLLPPAPTRPPFHLAFPVTDLDEARRFYGGLLRCPEGRSSPEWVDFDLRGHQIVAHKVAPRAMAEETNLVDGDAVPVRHFGLVLPMPEWRALSEQLAAAGVAFVIEPHVRFPGQPGEQATMFFKDPFGNAIELKAFEDPGRLFAK